MPSYLNAGTTYIFNANQLSNVYTNTGTTDGGVINSILLNEDIVNQSGQAYPVNYLSLNLVRTNDNPSTVNISFGRGPGQPGVYLDRDGSYALPSSNFSASAYYFGGLLSVSVAAQPTTSPEPASMWLAGLALSSGVALRLRSVKRRK